MIKVSVIVPVYNTEKYLRKCLDSLVNQTLKEVEIIVIDDKSTDNSRAIINEYEKKHANIKVIHNKTNQGIGYNRNLGIKKASGEFISFIDSDDYLDLDNLEKMYLFAKKEKLDMVVCNLKKVNDQESCIGYEKIDDFSFGSLKDNPNLLLAINMGPANKLFSKNLFKDENVRFSEVYKYEDLAVIPKLIASAKKIGKINDTYYNYVIHDNSQTTTMNDKVFDVLKVLDIVNNYLENLKYYDDIKEWAEFLNMRTIFRYTLQQKNQKNKQTAFKFIDTAFNYLNKKFPCWRYNKIWKKRSRLKRIVEGSQALTKLYTLIKW